MGADGGAYHINQAVFDAEPVFNQLGYKLGIIDTITMADKENIILLLNLPMVFSMLSTSFVSAFFLPRTWIME